VANGKRRKTRIFQLDQEEGIIQGEENLKKYITKYYKGLFGCPEKNNFLLVESMTNYVPRVTNSENEFLIPEFLEKEVRDAIFR
jgi:hypothetical protein